MSHESRSHESRVSRRQCMLQRVSSQESYVQESCVKESRVSSQESKSLEPRVVSRVLSRAIWGLQHSARLARARADAREVDRGAIEVSARARADAIEVSPRSTTEVSRYGLFMGSARKGQNVAGAEEESRATNLSIPRSERQRERFGSVLHLAGRTIDLA